MSAGERERQVSERDHLARLAMFVVDDYIIDMRSTIRTDSEMVNAAVRATIGFLIGRQLVTVRPQEELPEWLNASIPEHLIPR
jgi:hypothetical protein